jgi:predicted RND superfamily exporter protein
MHVTRRVILKGVLGVVGRPRLTLALCLMVLGACVGLAVWRLSISTDQNELFSAEAPFFRDYLTFVQKFPENEAIYVVVEAKEGRPGVSQWTLAADALAEKLSGLKGHVVSVDHRVPLDKLGRQGILFEEPGKLAEVFEEAKRFTPLVKLWGEKPGTLEGLLGRTPMQRFLAGLMAQPADARTGTFVEAVLGSWNRTLMAGEVRLVDLAALDASDPSRLGYYYVRDESDRSKHLLLVRVYPRRDFTSLTAISETVEAIRGGVREVAKGWPEFSFGVTGRPALEADEMRTTDRDTRVTEIVALSAIFVGLVLVLRSWWLALAAELALGVGIGWTFGWATVAVGRLNLLSMVFLLALIGIGMDYLIQILSRYTREISRRRDPRLIWVAVFRQVGAPINTACLGAAGAFLVSVFTDFRGAAELGIIAGGGLLICLLAGYTVLPAVLTLFPAKRRGTAEARRRGDRKEEISDLRFQRGRFWVMPLLWVVLLAVGAPFMFRTGFDAGLIELQAPNLESVRVVRKLETWFSVVMSKDLGVLRAAREAVKSSDLVERTESVLLAYDNYEWLKGRRGELPGIAWAEPTEVRGGELGAIAQLARNLAKKFSGRAGEALVEFAMRLEGHGDNEAAARWLSEWQKAFVGQLRELLAQFDPAPPDVSKLPGEMRGHFVSDDGTYALYIYPREDLWDHEALGRFVREVEGRLAGVSGEKAVTGIASNIYHSTSSIRRSFYKSTFYALGLILVLVLIDMRRIGDTLMAVSVLALGLPMLVAVMGLFKIDWNFANFFGLPILIGAGHEYGVFMVHRYREVVEDPRRVWRGWDVADSALLLCAFVTSSSFAFFWMLGHHEGLRSLGLIMGVGCAGIYLATVMVLRPVLRWRLRKIQG